MILFFLSNSSISSSKLFDLLSFHLYIMQCHGITNLFLWLFWLFSLNIDWKDCIWCFLTPGFLFVGFFFPIHICAVLLWMLTAACIKTGRPQIARKTIELAESRLLKDSWPEYYDGKLGRYIGKQARKYQTWSISGYLVAKMMLEDPSHLGMISLEEDKQMKPVIRRSSSWTCWKVHQIKLEKKIAKKKKTNRGKTNGERYLLFHCNPTPFFGGFYPCRLAWQYGFVYNKTSFFVFK